MDLRPTNLVPFRVLVAFIICPLFVCLTKWQTNCVNMLVCICLVWIWISFVSRGVCKMYL